MRAGTNYVGGLVGHGIMGTISACYATGDASGASDVGGLVGENFGGTISACYAAGMRRGLVAMLAGSWDGIIEAR